MSSSSASKQQLKQQKLPVRSGNNNNNKALFRLLVSAVAVFVSAGSIIVNFRHLRDGGGDGMTSASTSSIISNSLCTSKTSSISSNALAVQVAPFPSFSQQTPLHKNSKKKTTTVKKGNHKNNDQKRDEDETSDTSMLTILPHELPGYTGWARPLYTLVDNFAILGFSASVATAGHEWSVKVACQHHVQCRRGGALFYVRAYGRSLLPGRVVDHANGRYTITILPHDVGRYTLEVVLTISKKPDWEELPLKGRPGEPSYEGYLLPGFPLSFSVVEPKVKQKSTKSAPLVLPLCRAQELLETSTDSALSTGRWLVVNKTRRLPYPQQPEMQSAYSSSNRDNSGKSNGTTTTTSSEFLFSDTEQINIDTYTNSLASVGFQMDYFHNDCNVLTLDQISDKHTWHAAMQASALDISKQKALHLLFIGDSNTRNQYNYFRDYVAKPTSYMAGLVKHTYIDMMGDWPTTFNHTREMLYNITVANADTKDDHFFVVFNVGLHEVTNRCSINGMRKGLKLEGKCHEVYQKDVQQLMDLMQRMLPRALIKIWQSTTAGWPKWGLFGVGWPQHYGQKFPREPNFCGYINDLAWPIVQGNNSNNNNDVHVMDTYWLTLSRPDHREVVEKESIRTFYKLVHLGPEVYSILVRKFVTIILEAVQNVKKPGVPYNPHHHLPGAL
jgi:hypothetical protein